jgi:hypothetical protein
LRHPIEFELIAGLLYRRQIGAVGHLLHQLVEQVYHLGTRALQGLDDAHARDEFLLLRLQVVDFLDLLVEHLDLGAQPVVASFLRVDHRANEQIGNEGRDRGQCRRGTQCHEKCQFSIPSLLVAPRKQINTRH